MGSSNNPRAEAALTFNSPRPIGQTLRGSIAPSTGNLNPVPGRLENHQSQAPAKLHGTVMAATTWPRLATGRPGRADAHSAANESRAARMCHSSASSWASKYRIHDPSGSRWTFGPAAELV